jgi:hypothetical protein
LGFRRIYSSHHTCFFRQARTFWTLRMHEPDGLPKIRKMENESLIWESGNLIWDTKMMHVAVQACLNTKQQAYVLVENVHGQLLTLDQIYFLLKQSHTPTKSAGEKVTCRN